MKVSDCCGRGPANDEGLCPKCRDHCEYVDDEEDPDFDLAPDQTPDACGEDPTGPEPDDQEDR